MPWYDIIISMYYTEPYKYGVARGVHRLMIVFVPFAPTAGKNFNRSIARLVCEGCLVARGAKIERIQFSKRGLKVCSKACYRQSELILRVSPTTVTLKDYYCTRKRLIAPTCVCVFKVTCQEFNHFVFIHFIPNGAGDVAMLYFESGHPLYKGFCWPPATGRVPVRVACNIPTTREIYTRELCTRIRWSPPSPPYRKKKNQTNIVSPAVDRRHCSTNIMHPVYSNVVVRVCISL